MLLSFILLIVLLVFLSFIKSLLYTFKHPTRVFKELRTAKQIYCGNNNKKVFTSYKFKIRAKPDFIYQNTNGDFILVEYKSRKGNIAPGDIHQLIATALAVRETYPNLIKGFVYTQGGFIKEIDFRIHDYELVKLISKEMNYVRDINAGYPVTFIPERSTCHVCLYNHNCNRRAY